MPTRRPARWTGFAWPLLRRNNARFDSSQLVTVSSQEMILFRSIRRKQQAGLLLSVPLMVALAGCKPLPPSKPASEFTPQEARGAAVFQVKCARCHYPTTTRGKHGPGLQALTRLKAMPSGAPPTDERIAQTILHGHAMMEPVAINDADLEDLLAYLHTL